MLNFVLALKREEAKKAGGLRGAAFSLPLIRMNLGALCGASTNSFSMPRSRQRLAEWGSAAETLWAEF